MMGKLATSLGAAAISLLLIGCAPQLDASLTELENGDCVKDPGPIFQVDSLEHVDCDGQAVLQVTSIFQIKGYDEWPVRPPSTISWIDTAPSTQRPPCTPPRSHGTAPKTVTLSASRTSDLRP